MPIDWSRIAVQLHNEARQLLDAGELVQARERFAEAKKALPEHGKPALDGLVHYGLAETLLGLGHLDEAARACSRFPAGQSRGREPRRDGRLPSIEGSDPAPPRSGRA